MAMSATVKFRKCLMLIFGYPILWSCHSFSKRDSPFHAKCQLHSRLLKQNQSRFRGGSHHWTQSESFNNANSIAVNVYSLSFNWNFKLVSETVRERRPMWQTSSTDRIDLIRQPSLIEIVQTVCSQQGSSGGGAQRRALTTLFQIQIPHCCHKINLLIRFQADRCEFTMCAWINRL